MSAAYEAAPDQVVGRSITQSLADRITGTSWADLTPEAVTVAKQMLLDWLGVTLAARDEPLVAILMSVVGAEVQAPECALIGRRERANLGNAALINGAAGHALDFDDVISAMGGHPTVPVAPAVLALAELQGASGRAALLAFIVGVEIETRIARLMGPSHYAKGWHCTGTYGTFGAMAAAAKLYGLQGEALLHAFGLAGAQAAGLKSVFGTMTKPLHPGKAAQNGLMAARLARRGFTSDTDILASAQGFADTQSAGANPAAALAEHPLGFHVVDALFKYHAACYLTHDAIEAANALRLEEGVAPADIAAVTVKVPAGHLGVCNIQDPRTGLECKFSLRMTTALALSGEDTFEEALFSDATARRPDLVALRERVSIDPTQTGRGCVVSVRLKDGRELSRTGDVSQPMRDLASQQAKLERKFRHIASRALGAARTDEVIGLVGELECQSDLSGLLALCAG